MEHDETLLTVADMDWERFIPVFTSARPSPLLGDLPEVRDLPKAAGVDRADGDPEWVRRIDGLSPDEQERLMLDLVRAEIATVLGYPSADLVDAEADVLEIGVTSISAVELRATLMQRTGLDLPGAFIYDLYTPAGIADFLLKEFVEQGQGNAEPKS